MSNMLYRKILGLEPNVIHRNYTLWGPSAHLCTTLLDWPQIETHTSLVNIVASSFTMNHRQFQQLDEVLLLDRLFVVRPISGSRSKVTVNIGSGHLAGILSRAYADCSHVDRLRFYNTINENEWFSSSLAYIFETHILLWFRHAPAHQFIPCTPSPPAMVASSQLKIPVCRADMQFFNNEEELKHVDTKGLPKCLVPATQTFPTFDAFVITDNSIIAVQMTVATSQTASLTRFEMVYASLPRNVRARRRKYHVFVTDTEEKAKSLREKKFQDFPSDIDRYSASVDVDQLKSIFTTERVIKLNKDRVSIFWLYACDLAYWEMCRMGLG